MSNVKVKALSGFEHNGTRKKSDEFTVTPGHALQLEKKGLVKVLGQIRKEDTNTSKTRSTAKQKVERKGKAEQSKGSKAES